MSEHETSRTADDGPLLWQGVEGQMIAGYRNGHLSELTLLGEITRERLQRVPLRKLSHPAEAGAAWSWEERPTSADIVEWLAETSTPADLETGGLVKPFSKRELATLRKQLDRDRYETPDEFYAAVAEIYGKAVQWSGTPTKQLAEWAGVPRSTSARWVREARKRSYLPEPKHGKVW